MSDHIKVLAEMAGISTDAMRIIIAAKEQEKFICDLYGVKSLSELEQLKKAGEQAAALKWLGSRAAISGLYHSPAQLAEPAANERASDIGRPAKPPIEQPESAARCDLVGEPGQVHGAKAKADNKSAELGWKARVQAEAAALWIRIRKSGGTPKVYNIKDDMARWCRANDVKTDDGVYPSAGYLRTHVLSSKHWTPPS